MIDYRISVSLRRAARSFCHCSYAQVGSTVNFVNTEKDMELPPRTGDGFAAPEEVTVLFTTDIASLKKGRRQ